MRNAIALALLAAGTILAFTVSAQVPGISLRGAGVIIILTGIAALVMPPSPAADWLRNRVGTDGPGRDRPGKDTDDADDAYPDYLLQDPAVLAAEVLNGIRSDRWRQDPEAGRRGDEQQHAGQDEDHDRQPARPAAARRTLYSVRDLDRRDGVG